MSTTSNQYGNANQNPQNLKPAAEQPSLVQQAVTGATNLANSAVETVKSYVQPADPLTNYRNHQLHVGGVGDLGTRSETDVVRLPEERINPDPIGQALPRTDMGATNRSGVAKSPLKLYHGPIGGVGDLGTASEVDVVRLPEERAHPDPFSETPAKSTQQAQVIPQPIETAAPGLGGHTGTHHDITKEGHSGGVTGANHDVDHGLGHPWTRDSKTDSIPKVGYGHSAYQTARAGPEIDASVGKPRAANQIETAESSQLPTAKGTDHMPHDDTAGSPTTGKVKTMDKIKGSLEIAQGKLMKNEDKIDHGRALKSGQLQDH